MLKINKIFTEDNKKEVIQIFKNAPEDLKEFLGVEKLKIENWKDACILTANTFNKYNPQTEQDYEKFYEEFDDYVYENVFCDADTRRTIIRLRKFVNIFSSLNCDNILEISAGSGSMHIALRKLGFKVHVDGLSSSLVSKFFQWRCKKYGIEILENNLEKYDAVFNIDVIEHVYDFESFIEYQCKLSDKIIYIDGIGVHEKERGGYPQHIDHSRTKIIKKFNSLGFEKQKLNIGFPPKVFIKNDSKRNNK